MNRFKLHFLLTLLLVFFQVLGSQEAKGQDLAGTWNGVVWQDNSQDTFYYELRLVQGGEALTGQASSRSADGKISASFSISGRVADQTIRLQEIEQLSPADPAWCLKYLTLTTETPDRIVGEWTATGCRPGFVALQRSGSSHSEEIPFSYPGRWSGHLSQSDRDYGFYYELNLSADGTGTSNIVSEDAGGEALHQLEWEETASGIRLTESQVIERTDPQWKWCLKSAELTQSRKDGTYELTGDWRGFLEDKTAETGSCAPGAGILE